MEGFLGPGHCEQSFSWISFYSCFLYLYELLQSPPFMCEHTKMLGVKVLAQIGHTASKYRKLWPKPRHPHWTVWSCRIPLSLIIMEIMSSSRYKYELALISPQISFKIQCREFSVLRCSKNETKPWCQTWALERWDVVISRGNEPCSCWSVFSKPGGS